MTQKSKLEDSLKEFALAVKKLIENPRLESALEANHHSLKFMAFFYERALTNKEAGSKYVIGYNKLVSLCLKEFKKMIPNLDGQAWHVELYSEQMRGRASLINRIYHPSNS